MALIRPGTLTSKVAQGIAELAGESALPADTSTRATHMEYRNDLAETLLSGLPDDERSHVVDIIRQTDAEQLEHKRASDGPPPANDDEESAETADI